MVASVVLVVGAGVLIVRLSVVAAGWRCRCFGCRRGRCGGGGHDASCGGWNSTSCTGGYFD